MYRGAALPGASIAYETWGSLNPTRDNAVLLFTGLSPSAHAASSPEDPREGWWESMLGPGRAIDTERWFVVCINSLGSCFGSSGPASLKPGSKQSWRLDFPELSVEDIARGGFETLRTLGVQRPAAVVGASLGGMAVLAFVALFPGCARRMICISGTAAASPLAIALRAVQREAILRDPQWQAGQYLPDKPPRNGMGLARKLGTITYRSPLEWNERFGRAPLTRDVLRSVPPTAAFAPEFAIEGYLEAQAEKFASSFDANCYLYLSRAMDRFDVTAHANSLHEVFARAKLEAALVIGVTTDMLFPIGEQARIAEALRTAGVLTDFAPLQCREGHDAFLIDTAQFAPPVQHFLQSAGA
jgi:homoserine O-acetyltransferase